MKINRLETHDRLLEFKKQSDYISQGCLDCIKNRPKEFQNYPFYIFAHARTIETDERIAVFNEDLRHSLLNPNYQRQYQSVGDVPAARFLWQPRLTKPKAQENSMLFKAYPPGDEIKVIWMIPARELWDQYDQGKMIENNVVSESLYNFKVNKEKLEAAESDDLPEWRIKAIQKEIGKNFEKRKDPLHKGFEPII
jgi:hypothetical protein